MKLRFDSYTIHARFFPALVTALPLFVLWFFLSEYARFRDLMGFLVSVRFFGGITFAAVFLYFYAQLLRTISKVLEKKYFWRAKGFPTAYLMLYRDGTFSKNYKDLYRQRVHIDFAITLPSEEEERQNSDESRKRLSEITKHVMLRVGDGVLVKKHNVWYGFWRNSIGGAFFGVAFCSANIIAGICYFQELTLWLFSSVLLIPYVVIVIFHKPIMLQHAEAYAKQLIAEYMSQPQEIERPHRGAERTH